MTTKKERRQTTATEDRTRQSARSASPQAGRERGEPGPTGNPQTAAWASAAAPFAELAGAAAKWLPEQVTNAWTESVAEIGKAR